MNDLDRWEAEQKALIRARCANLRRSLTQLFNHLHIRLVLAQRQELRARRARAISQPLFKEEV